MNPIKTFMQKIEPRDVISLVLIAGCITLKIMGKNGTVSLILISIVGYYYGAVKRWKTPVPPPTTK